MRLRRDDDWALGRSGLLHRHWKPHNCLSSFSTACLSVSALYCSTPKIPWAHTVLFNTCVSFIFKWDVFTLYKEISLHTVRCILKSFMYFYLINGKWRRNNIWCEMKQCFKIVISVTSWSSKSFSGLPVVLNSPTETLIRQWQLLPCCASWILRENARIFQLSPTAKVYNALYKYAEFSHNL